MGAKIIPGEEKSKVEVEKELVEKHEQEVQEQTEAVEQPTTETPTEPVATTEETQADPQPDGRWPVMAKAAGTGPPYRNPVPPGLRTRIDGPA